MCLLSSHEKDYFSEPSLRGRGVLKGRADMKGASKKDERNEYADSPEGGTPSFIEFPRDMAHTMTHPLLNVPDT